MTSPLPPQRPLEPQPCALVVGASSGIGAALVRELVRRGYRVAAVARRQTELDQLAATLNANQPTPRVLAYAHDVKAFDEIPTLFQRIIHELGGLDMVIYNAGVMPAVGLDEYDFAKDKAQIEVNLLGAMAWLNETAARFQRAGNGRIVGISSVAGDRGRRGNPAYNTSKAALTTYLEALRNRLTQHGVNVTTIKPGFVQTDMLANAAKTFWVISPESAAQQIVTAAEKNRQTVYIPWRWGLVMLIIRHIPSFIFRRMGI